MNINRAGLLTMAAVAGLGFSAASQAATTTVTTTSTPTTSTTVVPGA